MIRGNIRNSMGRKRELVVGRGYREGCEGEEESKEEMGRITVR